MDGDVTSQSIQFELDSYEYDYFFATLIDNN